MEVLPVDMSHVERSVVKFLRGIGEQRFWDGKAERLGGVAV
jgi:hypothetical protein